MNPLCFIYVQTLFLIIKENHKVVKWKNFVRFSYMLNINVCWKKVFTCETSALQLFLVDHFSWCLHTWVPPLALVSRPSVDREEGGRGRGPMGVAGWGWLTCEATSSVSQRSSSSFTSLSICSLWVSASRPKRSSCQTQEVHGVYKRAIRKR